MIQSHHLPTCDDVFDVLTRGPFPTGQHEVDWPLERHLTVCHSCRELAEALRPATEMLADSQTASPPQQPDWPVYLAEIASPAQRSGGDSGQAKRHDSSWSRHVTWGVALSFGWMLVLGVTWLAAPAADSGGKRVLPPPLLVESPEPQAALPGAGIVETSCSLAAVDGFHAVGQQRPEPHGNLLAHNFTSQACCSQCHHPGQNAEAGKTAAIAQAQIVALVSRCVLCHGQ